LNKAVQAIGAILTILGIIFLIYVFYYGATHGAIGSSQAKMTTEAWLALLGWFFILVGPALWLGETPVAVKKRLKR